VNVPKTKESTVLVVEVGTLTASENLKYESDELDILRKLNYLNKGYDQATGMNTLEGSNWLDDIVD
jgi:hypothetical protein